MLEEKYPERSISKLEKNYREKREAKKVFNYVQLLIFVWSQIGCSVENVGHANSNCSTGSSSALGA